MLSPISMMDKLQGCLTIQYEDISTEQETEAFKYPQVIDEIQDLDSVQKRCPP